MNHVLFHNSESISGEIEEFDTSQIADKNVLFDETAGMYSTKTQYNFNNNSV